MTKFAGIVGDRRDRRLKFDESDFEILDLTLEQAPDLRLCAGVVRAARAAEIKYPIKSVKTLLGLLPVRELFIEGHRLRADLIVRYMRDEYLPISNEAELVSRCYLALMRCREDMRWAAQAPSYATELLAELPKAPQKKGRK